MLIQATGPRTDSHRNRDLQHVRKLRTCGFDTKRLAAGTSIFLRISVRCPTGKRKFFRTSFQTRWRRMKTARARDSPLCQMSHGKVSPTRIISIELETYLYYCRDNKPREDEPMARVVAGPTELELLILKVLWKAGGPLIVRDVRERLADDEGRDLAHTTVVTMLHTMTDKKLVHRRQVNARAYSFEALVEEDAVSKGMLEDLLTRVFDGSASSLLVSLLDSGHVSKDEHRELRRLVNRRRNLGDEA